MDVEALLKSYLKGTSDEFWFKMFINSEGRITLNMYSPFPEEKLISSFVIVGGNIIPADTKPPTQMARIPGIDAFKGMGQV